MSARSGTTHRHPAFTGKSRHSGGSRHRRRHGHVGMGRAFDGVTELQPGSFLLMDAAYHAVRPEFGCSLSILATVVTGGQPGTSRCR